MRRIIALGWLSRNLVRLGPLFAVVFLLSIADTFLSGYLEPKNSFRTLVNNTQPVNGKLDIPVKSADALRFISDSLQDGLHIQMTFLEGQGRLWRGELYVAADTSPGTYDFQVAVEGHSLDNESLIYHIIVFDDKKQLNAANKSFIRRHLGISPAWLILAMVPLLIGSLAGSYYQSSHQENLLAREGIVPILKMVRRKEGWEIMFALGSRHGLQIGDKLYLLNKGLEKIIDFKVFNVTQETAQARIPFDETVDPSCWVALPKIESSDESRLNH